MLWRLLLVPAVMALLAAAWWRRRPGAWPAHFTGDLILMYFWGPHCPACTALKSGLEQLIARDNRHRLELRFVNAARERDQARQWNVRTVPTIILADREGRAIFRKSGALILSELESTLRKLSHHEH